MFKSLLFPNLNLQISEDSWPKIFGKKLTEKMSRKDNKEHVFFPVALLPQIHLISLVVHTKLSVGLFLTRYLAVWVAWLSP